MQEISLNGQSHDIVKENVEKLKQLFPEIVTEDNIDFDKLKAVLGKYIEKEDESYRFTWYGKRDAFRKSQIPSTGTLRPCIEDSKDWDTTQNLYIEGDNLEVLKLLQKSYSNKIKMIYIDPPYNKDRDFIYPDKWSDPIKEYKKITGQIDEDGNVTSSDTEDEGGRHTRWLNMMYPRLRLARNLLTDDGVIFISIDDNEIHNMRKLCDEIFGEENFVASIIWKHTQQSKNDEPHFSRHFNYIVTYAKNIDNLSEFYFKRTVEDNKNYSNPDNDPKGDWRSGDVRSPNYRKTLCFDLIAPNGNIIKAPENGWRWSKASIDEKIASGEIIFKDDYSGIIRKIYLCEQDGRTPENVWAGEEFGTTREANSEIKELFDRLTVFDTPKPTKVIRKIMQLFHKEDEYTVLDFFSGSATTAHAVMQSNAEDCGSRKFILVQLPEPTSEKDDAYKAGYENICEIGKERIRRAGEKIIAELQEKYDAYQQRERSLLDDEEEPPMNPDDLDIGFKVFELDDSNLRKWSVDVGEDFYKESKEAQNAILAEMLGIGVDNFVRGRSELDVVYEIMLKYGLDLTYPIETYDFDGTNIYSIGYGGLIVCLDTDIGAELADRIVELIKELEPSMVRVAVRDLSFSTDSEKTNFKETLRNGVDAYFESSDDKADKQNQFKFITI